jgi:hypothetical protein
MNTSIHSARQNRGFTLTDLLVLIATLAVLVLVTYPALATIQDKGGRVECANNLRQIGMESMIYAGENSGWLPICTLGAANSGGSQRNHLGGVHYTQYVYLGTANLRITTNEPPVQGQGYQNLGYLFKAGLAGNGNIFYCPALWGHPFMGADSYSPLLTTDSTGIIRSSYMYNPRITSATPTSNNNLRKYQTTSQLEPHRLFALDYLRNETGAVTPGIQPAWMPHARDHGWNVLFTDGSVQFCRLTKNNNLFYNAVTTQLITDESALSLYQYDQTFTGLEQDR